MAAFSIKLSHPPSIRRKPVTDAGKIGRSSYSVSARSLLLSSGIPVFIHHSLSTPPELIPPRAPSGNPKNTDLRGSPNVSAFLQRCLSASSFCSLLPALPVSFTFYIFCIFFRTRSEGSVRRPCSRQSGQFRPSSYLWRRGSRWPTSRGRRRAT